MLIELFNLVEGLWWIGLGVWLMSFAAISKCYKTALASILILFGISDFVEMATGAWWQPWWLLAWKGLCVAVGIILIILIFNERKSR
jgi:hypothetical protein